MRSERQREIMAQLEAEKRAAKKNRGIVLFRIISILYVILAAAFVVLLWRMDVLPAKYLYGGIAVLVIASIFIVPVMYSKNGKKGRYVYPSSSKGFLLRFIASDRKRRNGRRDRR